MPSSLATDMSRTADSRTWPTLPAGPSSSSTVIVWMESTIVRAGPLGAHELGDPADLALGDDPHRPAGRPVEEAEARGPEPDLGRRFLAGRVEDPAVGRRRPVGDAGRGLEQERGLADPRLAADEHERARDEPAAEHPVELADADRQARDVGRADLGEGRQGRLRAGASAVARAAARPAGRGHPDEGLDEAVPAAARAALALPAQEGLAAGLADVPTLGLGHAYARRPRLGGLDGDLRLGGVDLEAGVLALVHDDRRARARSGRAAGARRGRPRRGSGSPGGAAARRRRRRSRA